MVECDNCSRRWDETTLKVRFPDIPGMMERIEPGGTVPAGECPECGALVYPVEQPVRVLVLIEGGLVQEVLADQAGVEVAVLDQDTEGADEDEIERLVGDRYDLRGTLQAHEPTVAPELIDQAWRPVEQVSS